VTRWTSPFTARRRRNVKLWLEYASLVAALALLGLCTILALVAIVWGEQLRM
jgi:hypothetical protein